MSNCGKILVQPDLLDDLSNQSKKEAYESTDKISPEKFVMGVLRGESYPDGITPIQLQAITGWHITTARPALSRLKRKGLLTVSKRIKDARCKTAVCVYILTDEGRLYK